MFLLQTENPTLQIFQELLERNALIFYSARTAKVLFTHWQLMKQYSLLPDQTVQVKRNYYNLLILFSFFYKCSNVY